MDKDNSSSAHEISRRYEAIANWPFLRKFETLVFTAMFLALPLFAWKVVDHTSTALAVKNSAVDLCNQLIESENNAKLHATSITVTSKPASGSQPCTYLIEEGGRTVERVLLPPGVNLIGSVTFEKTGRPQAAASFIVSKGTRTYQVEIDTTGLISTP